MLPNPDSILRKTGRGIEVYRELKNDPHVWSCIQSRKSGVLSLNFELQKVASNDEIFNIIEKMLESLDLYQFESDCLEAPLFGFQPIEIIWFVKDKLILPKELKARPQEEFAFDSNNQLLYRTYNGST